jgi:hypothetical protein
MPETGLLGKEFKQESPGAGLALHSQHLELNKKLKKDKALLRTKVA